MTLASGTAVGDPQPAESPETDGDHFTLGDLEVDVYGDFWADHDEDCHGEIDTAEMREEFPDGFIWEGCCGQRGSAKGCEVSEHVAAPFTAKKRRS